MTLRILLIDDDKQNIERYAEKIRRIDKVTDLRVYPELLPDNKDELTGVFSRDYDLIILDYDFSRKPSSEIVFDNGITLASLIKQKHPDIPMILFTRKTILNLNQKEEIAELLEFFDDVIYKRDLSRDSTIIIGLIRLAEGVKNLRNNKTNGWNGIKLILKANDDEIELIKKTSIPIIDGKAFSPVQIGQIIRNELLKYPGILYNSLYAATLLGITEQEFQKENIQEYFQDAKYQGIFTPVTGLWWKDRLIEIASSRMNDEEKIDPLNHSFAKYWLREQRGELSPSICIYRGEKFPEQVCHLLSKPVKTKYSLKYKPDNRPAVMDKARVSYKAIKTSSKVNLNFLDSLGREIVEELRGRGN